MAVLLVAFKGSMALGDPEHLQVGVRAAGAELGVEDDDVTAWGQGTFEADTSGTHVACYQQVAPFPGGPDQPRAPEPEVLGVVIERGGIDADEGDDTEVLPQGLSQTGAEIPSLLFVAGVAGLLGTGLLRRHLPDGGSTNVR